MFGPVSEPFFMATTNMLTHLPSCSFGGPDVLLPFPISRSTWRMRNACAPTSPPPRGHRPLYETPLPLLLPRNEWSLIKNKPAASQLRTNHYTTDYVICRLCPLLLATGCCCYCCWLCAHQATRTAETTKITRIFSALECSLRISSRDNSANGV